ncbi:PepSY-associated TM helix domain-containing protein [Pseudaquidulcibacter saccharophilus]|uniref:PepSY-associated TM helix domain-containing protein n=1 Tax=Pseudaquidulcibacter saccharophilus TaxID=2831900 RepID=UPI0023D90E49|nr:PepSY-associated TM helix domain-containing protein [Pseudaquidulcibacter saccharophilus]
MFRFYFAKIHAICGLLVSLMLVLMALTGIFLVFRNEYIMLSLGQGVFAPKDIQPLNGLMNILPHLELGKIKSIMLPDNSLPLFKIIYGENILYYDLSGVLLDNQPISSRFDEIVFKLHHYLLLGEKGEVFIGITGLLLLFMTLSGLYLILPVLKSFEFKFLPKTSKRRDIIAHHRNLGLIFAPMLVIIAISGSAMIFSDSAKSILGAITFSKPLKLPKAKIEPSLITADTIKNAINLANHEFPNGEIRIISLPKKPDEPINIRIRQNGEWHGNGRTFISFSPAKNQIIAIYEALKLDRATTVYNGFYPLHSSRGIGLWYKIIVALTGMALLMLGLFSAFSYGRKLIQTKKI